MKGLELARRYYEAYGREMLEVQFKDVFPKLAIGLSGSGSECFGYDDLSSQDHDFEPCFIIFLPDEVDDRTEFLLERAYSRLPKEFMGFKRSILSPVGGNRHGVKRIKDFFLEKTGSGDGILSLEQWLSVPEYSLLEATNGEIFTDNYGQLTFVREMLRYFPEDVRRKKLAGHLLLMGQAGQYNYNRCIKRGENGAAQLALFEFVKSAINSIYLLNRTYMPYYKWCFRGLRELPVLSNLAKELEYLISADKKDVNGKTEAVEKVCSLIVSELKAQGLTASDSAEMERQAYVINNTVSDNNIRNLNILYGV